MSNISIEYSLNTPVFSNQNILNQKIFALGKNNNMKGGYFNADTSNSIALLIGIIITIIGFVLLRYKNNLVEVDAIITSKSCDDEKNGECVIGIKYIAKSIQYSKIITINKSNILNSQINQVNQAEQVNQVNQVIKVYYSESNPDFIQLFNPNYYAIGVGSVIFGLFVVFYSLFNYSTPSNSDSNIKLKTSSSSADLYSNSTNVDGFNVVYS
jgi:hypothetical protein